MNKAIRSGHSPFAHERSRFESQAFRRRAAGLFFLAMLVCLLGAHGALAQNLTGEIDGVVKDTSGALVPNAAIVVTNADQNLTVRNIQSNGQGEFTASALAIGNYSLLVSAPGFESTKQNVEVHVGVQQAVAVVLQPGSLSQTVTVTTDIQAPQLESNAAGTLIPSTKVTELPLSSRNFLQLLSIQPGISGGIPGPQDRGAISARGTVNSANFSVSGLPGAQNGFFVDGEDLQRRSAGGTQIAAYPGIDFIQEVNLQRSNYGAQYGGSGSAFISINTKVGSTAFHGTAYEFFRSQILNANDYFNNLAGVARPGLRYNDFGYTIGGPVWIPKVSDRNRSKTFFFFGQEFLRSETNSQETLTNLPTAAQRNGVFGVPVCVTYNAAGNCTATAKSITAINPVAQAYLTDILNKTPLPNSPTDPQGLIVSEPGFNNETQTLIRIDHQFTQKLNVFFRYLDDPFHLVVPNGLRQPSNAPGVGTARVTDGATLFLGHATYVLSSKNVLEGGFAHIQGWVTAQTIGFLAAANSPDIHVTLPYPTKLGRVPNLTINGRSFSTISPYNNREPISQTFVNDTQTIGRHTLYFGVNLEYQQEGNNGGTINAGAFNFAPGKLAPGGETQFDQAFANFLLGKVTNFQQTNVDSAGFVSTNIYEAYAQDDFHASPRLTLNLGLRYSYFAQPTSVHTVSADTFLPIVNFAPSLYNPSAAPTLTSAGLICTKAPCTGGGVPNPAYKQLNGLIIGGQNSPYGNKVVHQPKLGFAPRFGFADDVFGNGRTSLRGGFGIYYLVGVTPDQQQMISLNPPGTVNTVIANTSFADPGSVAASATPAPGVLHAQQINPVNPYLETYNVDAQQQIGQTLLVDVGYFGNHSLHDPVTEDINVPLPGVFAQRGIIAGNVVTPSNTQTLNLVRPYQGYGPINFISNAFSSNYNSLQVSISKRFQGKSVVALNYTYSKALTNVTAPQNIYNPAAEYGPSGFDRTHILNVNYVYDLPFFKSQRGLVGHLLGGFETTGVFSLGSGLPLTPNTAAVDPAGQGILATGSSEGGTGRPDYISNPNQGAPHTRIKWFNTAAFSNVPAGQYRPGTASNGSIRGPGYGVLDVGAFRNIQLKDQFSFQLRAEAFNVFNHTNFQGVSTLLGQTNYGQVTSAGPARLLQLGAKFIF